MDQNLSVEERSEPRKPLDVYLNKFTDDEPFMVRSADISRSGIYVHKLIEPELSESSTVSLELKLPNSEEVIWARGAIVREGKRWGAEGVGIFFTVIPDGYRRLIEQYVSTP